MAQRRRRKQTRRTSAPTHLQYEWAFDAAGHPVHISHAERGSDYFCPLCWERMVARQGDVKRHHFSHDQKNSCTPTEVTRAAAGKWIAEHASVSIAAQRSLMLTWPCPLCRESHTSNLLDGITQVQQDYAHHDLVSTVALLDATDTIRGAFLFHKPDSRALTIYGRESITVIVIDPARARHWMDDLPTLLRGSIIYGGLCTTQRAAARKGIISDVNGLRAALTEAVSTPPYHAYGPLDHLDGLTHVFALDECKLWLPPILWQRAIGGLHHSINPALQIISQEWPQDDGSTIALYYVTAKDEHAIAVRRFAPGQPVYARLNTAVFNTGRLSAVGVARSFAEV
jgi:hypothetical protein